MGNKRAYPFGGAGCGVQAGGSADDEKREKVIEGLKNCGKIGKREVYPCEECPYYTCGCSNQLCRDALALLKEQEEDYPICEKCGRQIKNIHVSSFNYDGTDSVYSLPISYDKEHGCVLFETSKNWTGYGLTDEEVKEDIRCPYCGKYPFDESVEVRVVAVDV